MASVFIKATKVVNTALGVLERDLVLPNLVWRDAGGSFVGVFGDTITIRLPAYATARNRVMRSGATITLDDLDETSVNLKLDTEVYKAVKISTEQLTLDIIDLGAQVLAPVMGSITRKVEDNLAAEMQGAQYHFQHIFDPLDPWKGLIQARIDLNNANVPAADRFLAVGTNVEAALLQSDRVSLVINSGDPQALRDATLGKLAGFQVVSVPGLDPDIAIAAHKTAFVLSMQTPAISRGITWGETATWRGFAMRVLADYDPTILADRFVADVYMGTATTKDRGTFDGNGKFQATETGSDGPLLVRAVALELPGQAVFSS